MGNGRIAAGSTSVFKFACVVATLFAIFSSSLAATGVYKKVDIKWDVLQWTGDGYIAVVKIFNLQAPKWSLGWKWAKSELIWTVVGAKSTDRGDCSRFKTGINPSSCRKDPTIVGPYSGNPNQAASFQITVGNSGSTNSTVKIPGNFNLMAPGSKYTCGAAKIVRPSKFITPDGRRVTQAFMTWKVTCTCFQRQKTTSTS